MLFWFRFLKSLRKNPLFISPLDWADTSIETSVQVSVVYGILKKLSLKPGSWFIGWF
jgi:hypothetical protein